MRIGIWEKNKFSGEDCGNLFSNRDTQEVQEKCEEKQELEDEDDECDEVQVEQEYLEED